MNVETIPRERTVIAHCHMFKNAGSTLDWSLARNFGPQFLQLRGKVDGRSENEQLESLLRSGVDLRAVSGHILRQPLPRVAGVNLVPAFIVRHPIERAYSVYSFERGQVLVTKGSIQAKRLSFRDYIVWRMDPKSPVALCNYQSQFCAGNAWRNSPRPILDQALDSLRASPLVATVDLYDQCMVLFESVLRPHFPDLDLSYVRQNVGRYREGTTGSSRRFRPLRKFLEGIEILPGGDSIPQVDSRVNRILEMLGQDVADLLVAQNESDLKLYAEATALVNSRLQSVTDLDSRLLQFRQRCGSLKPMFEKSRLRAGADFMLYLGRIVRARLLGKGPGGEQAGASADSIIHPDRPGFLLATHLARAGIAREAIENLVSGTLSPERWLTLSRRQKLAGTGLDSADALSRALRGDLPVDEKQASTE